MSIVVIDFSDDMKQANQAIEVALATAQATERQAYYLLRMATAKPEVLERARDIYVRAKRRAARFEKLLGRKGE